MDLISYRLSLIYPEDQKLGYISVYLHIMNIRKSGLLKENLS